MTTVEASKIATFRNKVGKKLGLSVKKSKKSKQEFKEDKNISAHEENFKREDAWKVTLRSKSRPKVAKPVTSGHQKKRINQVKCHLLTEKKNIRPRTIWVSKHKEIEKPAKVRKAISRTKENKSDMVADVDYGLLKKSPKKSIQNKKALNGDSEEPEEKPKKRKRVIRIDPYDLSNKRLDDGLSNNGQ